MSGLTSFLAVYIIWNIPINLYRKRGHAMDNQSIDIFLAIAEYKSISAAARALNFSQPTVSDQLTQLEKKLGIKLVLREKGNRQIALTQAGKAFMPLAKRHKELQQMLKMEIEHFVRTQSHDMFRLAASISAHEHIMSTIVHKLMQRVPGTNLQLSTIEANMILEELSKGSFDAVFIFGKPPKSTQATTIPLYYEPRWVLCPADSPLPDRVLTAMDLDPSFEVLFHSPNINHVISYNKWREEHLPANSKPFFSVSSLTALHNYLTDPRCWTIIPASIALRNVEERKGELSIRYIDDDVPMRLFSLMVSKSYPKTGIIEELLNCCDDFMDERPYLQRIQR